MVSAETPTVPDVGEYAVHVQHTDANADDWWHAGNTRKLPFIVRDPRLVEGQSYRFTVVARSTLGSGIAPAAAPSATVTLNGNGLVPEDVTGFTAITDEGWILFAWTALGHDANADVVGYEIRAGATGWLSATFVAFKSGLGSTWIAVPRSRATGTSFYCKARTTTDVYSAAVASATLSAANATEADNTSPVGYQDVTVLAGATTVTVTTRATYTATPFIVCEHRQTGATALGIYKHHVYGFSVNGDNTYSFTLKISDAAPTGGVVVTVLEAEAM
jgi:hypothetical protein